ncbi:unnamed protein product [Malus baccata var. baccata]
MATSSEGQDTGYPAPPGQFPTGYPAAAPLPNILDRIISIVAVIAVVGGFFFFIIWFNIGSFTFPEFRVESTAVSPLNATSSELTATWNFTLLATNPSRKVTVFFDSLAASLIYNEGFPLTMNGVPDFVVPKSNQTRVNIKLAMVGEYVGDQVARGIADWKDRGTVRFTVGVTAQVRFEPQMYQRRGLSLLVFCDRVEFTGFAQNNGTGTLTGESSPCKVKYDD